MRGKVANETRFRKREDDGFGIHEPDRLVEQLWRLDWKKFGYAHCGIYVISTDSLFPCKIGVSVNPTKRLASLQTSHWRQLQISEYRWCSSVGEARLLEQESHSFLRENGKALLGEWFDVRPKEAVAAIEWAALATGISLRNDVPKEAKAYITAIVHQISNNRHVETMSNILAEIHTPDTTWEPS